MERTTAEFLDLVNPIIEEYLKIVKKANEVFLKKISEIPDLTEEELILFEAISKAKIDTIEIE